ncbi:MAG: CDP-alcohol phosphatidyltransferase family protein, partial [bacterium]
MTDSYRYNCIDKSLLLPIYKKYYVSAYFRLVPQWLTANMITIFSTGFIMAMAVMAFFFESKGSPWHALIFAFCLHSYLLGDHLDGMQAKESGTSSPLGEFLDHYLDVYNGAIVFYAVTVFLGPVPKGLFLVLMLLNCVAFAATMVEELERKELIFGYLGTLEGVLFLNAFFLSWLIPPIRAFWQRDLLWGYPVYWVIIIGLGLGYLGTIADILIRIGRVPKPFALFLICSTSFAYLLGHQPITKASAWLILILFSGDYISRVMNSYLQSKQHQYPDILSMASVLLVLVADLTG